jgi:penicillin-binding protein 1C
VLDVKTGKALCYVGNSGSEKDLEHGNNVDVINAPRSTGSVLKPFLFAFMLNEGLILPNTLVADAPTQVGGFVPQNYNLTYDGAVPAKRALSRSLNIPAVKMLQVYGIEKFNSNLKRLGMNTLDYPPSHYGLAIILGGAEGSLWNICGMYASMARLLNNSSSRSSVNEVSHIREPIYMEEEKPKPETDKQKITFLDPASIQLTFDAMVEVARPDEESSWQSFTSSHPIAWKTGTSFGYRDAWAIGVTPGYVIGVWAGNASGEGRPGLTGIGAAAPIMFDIFNLLRKNEWFKSPESVFKETKVCALSGHRKSMYCPDSYTQRIPKAGLNSLPCPYHRLVHLDKTRTYRVNSNCESVDNIVNESWFVLPPSLEWFYKSKNPNYKTLPPFKTGCNMSNQFMEFIYPKDNASIYVPLELDGSVGKTVFRIAHRNKNTRIYWHLDENFAGTTYGIHELGFNPSPGNHIITAVDENGESITEHFEIIAKEKNK